jgi:hypothetical protein
MEIAALIGKPVAEKVGGVKTGTQYIGGPSFLGAVSEAAREGKIAMPGGVEMEQLDLLRVKFGTDKGLEVNESDEEKVYGFLARIRRILEENKR